MKKVAIVDGNYLTYRSYYATIKWTKDPEMNGVYKFEQTLDFLFNEFSLNSIVAAFDPENGSDYRKKMYKDYKANRDRMPNEIFKQMELIKNLLISKHIKCYCRKGYEADDMIGILSNRLIKKFDKVYIVSSDKDMCQLITNKILILRYLNNEWTIIGKKYVKKRYDIWPKQFADYLALVGDSGDNISGAIKGVGPKTAAKLLKKYNNISNMLKISEFKKYRQQLILNRKLTTILKK